MSKYVQDICIIGSFDYANMSTGGQPVKSRELVKILRDIFPQRNIHIIETSNWKKRPFELFIGCQRAASRSSVIIMLPAQNGVEIFARLLSLYKRKNRKIYYDVIGGWLPEKTKTEKKLLGYLSFFDGIWVETKKMADDLKDQGLNNVCVIPNFKSIEPLPENELNYDISKPYKLCTFSRVMKEKGIEEAVASVSAINNELKDCVFTLDIYGQIDDEYKNRFIKLEQSFPDYIKYKGNVKPEKSVEVLKDYTALLFPTTYSGEGLAGTLLDALMSGVPIIATDWHYNSEIINCYNGFLIPSDNIATNITNVLRDIYHNIDIISSRKIGCIKSAQLYTREHAKKLIQKEIE